MRYTLLIDSNEDILNIQVMTLRCFYSGKIHTAKNGLMALEILKEKGSPELIISDQRALEENNGELYNFLEKYDLKVPFISCTAHLDPVIFKGKFPLVTAQIEKPFKVDALSVLVQKLTSNPRQKVSHIPVEISFMVKFQARDLDLYIKLSESNFVKISHANEIFSQVDADKLLNKGIDFIYIESKDCIKFLEQIEANIDVDSSMVPVSDEERINLSVEGLEAIELISKRLGWSTESLKITQAAISKAIGILSKDVNLKTLLKAKIKSEKINYSRHVGLQAYIACSLSEEIEEIGDSAPMKLVLASLLHDLSVEESYYGNIKSWNLQATNPKVKDVDTIKYRLHPFEAAKLAQSLEHIPADVEQIILQHHERKDGSGFPRAMDASRIGLLSTLFIVVEEFIDHINSVNNLETGIIDFITWADHFYDTGLFAKVYKVLRVRLVA